MKPQPSQIRNHNNEQAALVKARVGIDDCVQALELDVGEGTQCPNRRCDGIDSIKQSRNGETWGCDQCGEKGDIISMVRLRRNCGFGQAIEFLKRECLPAGGKQERLL